MVIFFKNSNLILKSFFFPQLNYFEHELAPAPSCLLFFQEMVELKDKKIRKIGGDFEIHLKNLFSLQFVFS